MYDDILVPTDGSSGADAAVDHGIHAAERDDAVVHAVHVVEIEEVGSVPAGPGTSTEFDAREMIQPILDAAEEVGVDTTEAILEGRAHEELLDYVANNDIDLVVMGTHGKSGLGRVLLGSTTERLVRHSPAPVLSVGQEAE